jgi:cation transporter-like permease
LQAPTYDEMQRLPAFTLMPMSTLTWTTVSAVLVRIRAVVWSRRAGTWPDDVPPPASAVPPSMTKASTAARAPHRARIATPCVPPSLSLRNDGRSLQVTVGRQAQT